MKYVVNIRGINASGKSTAVRQFCKKYDMKPDTIRFNGFIWKVMTNGKYIAIGHYKPYSNSEGCDPLNITGEMFKNFLTFILMQYDFEIVVYEKQIWSTTYKLTAEVRDLTKACGYSFIAVQMSINYSAALNRLFKRNGNNLGNLDNYDCRFDGVQRSRKKLIQSGTAVYDAMVSEIPEQDMYKIILYAIELNKIGARKTKIVKLDNL